MKLCGPSGELTDLLRRTDLCGQGRPMLRRGAVARGARTRVFLMLGVEPLLRVWLNYQPYRVVIQT